MQLEVYVFEDADGRESGWTTQDPVEAREYAERYMAWAWMEKKD
jgi:hypothetical protein